MIGVGNAFRADDGAGLAVARLLCDLRSAGVDVLEREGEPTALIDSWEGGDVVWLVDAISSGAVPGTVHRFEATDHELPAAFARTSSHHIGLPEAVELARTLGRLPRRLVVYGIEGATFEMGETLSSEAAAAVEDVAVAIRAEVAAAA